MPNSGCDRRGALELAPVQISNRSFTVRGPGGVEVSERAEMLRESMVGRGGPMIGTELPEQQRLTDRFVERPRP